MYERSRVEFGLVEHYSGNFGNPLDSSWLAQYDGALPRNGTIGGFVQKKFELDSMSLNDLWSLQERISTILSARIRAEKSELEKRLAVLNRGRAVFDQSSEPGSINGKPRRKYPRVLPKYRDPQTSETWSGRGKRPRWLVAAMKSGRKIEEFRINEGTSKGWQAA
jgi:DNA-binding protein H-NS